MPHSKQPTCMLTAIHTVVSPSCPRQPHHLHTCTVLSFQTLATISLRNVSPGGRTRLNISKNVHCIIITRVKCVAQFGCGQLAGGETCLQVTSVVQCGGVAAAYTAGDRLDGLQTRCTTQLLHNSPPNTLHTCLWHALEITHI